MAITDQREQYAPDMDERQPEPGVAQDERANEHRARALDALDADSAFVAIAEALFAVEARLDELTTYVAQRG